jgi:hypothetical protein
MQFHSSQIYKDMSITKFADILSAGLVERKRSAIARPPPNAKPLKRFVDEEGQRKVKRQATGNKRSDSPSSQQAYWECRRYYKRYVMTSFCCPYCDQPLCKVTRSSDSQRLVSCYVAHLGDRDDRPTPDSRPLRPRWSVAK